MDEAQAAILSQFQDSLIQLAFVLGTVLLLARQAKAQPSLLAFALMLMPVPILALSALWPWLAWVAVLYTPLLMLLMLIDGFFLSMPSRHLQFTRTLSAKLSIGQSASVVLTVFNNSAVPVSGMIRDSVPPGLLAGLPVSAATFEIQVAPYRSQEFSYRLLPGRRGLYEFERIHGRYRSRLGLLWLTVQSGRPEAVKVVPDLRRIRRMRILASRAQNAGELQKRSLGLEGTQFSGLRHYFSGDDIKNMAWQATAKLDQPVVRTFTHEVEQPILVLLDAGRKMVGSLQSDSGKRLQKYDWALNIALAFMAVAVDRGDCIGAGVFSNRLLAHVPLGSGRSHLNRLLEALGETEPQAVEPDYEAVMLQAARSLKRRSLVVVFTDLIDPMASRSLLRSLKGFSRNHLLMIVTLADSDLNRQVEAMPETAYEVYQKGVALDLQELRRQALRELSHTHQAVVVDAPVDVLDESLIQQYLRIKQRNRL